MNKNWQKKKLGEILKLEYGKPLIPTHRKNDGAYPIYGANGIKDFSDKFYYDKHSIIVGRKGSAGEINLTEEKFWPLDVTYFVTFDSKKYDLKFLFNLLSNLDLPKLAKGVKPGINRNEVYSIEVKVPSLLEQKQIVRVLDNIFEKTEKAKENAEKNIQNAKELFESYLQSIFSNPGKDWQERRLEELGQITSSKRIYKKEYAKLGVPFYRIKEIKELANNKPITIELYISKDRYKEIKDVFGIPKEGDLLMTAVGTIGEIYVVKKEEEFYFKDGNVLWFKNFDSVDPYFLKFVLIAFVEKIKTLSKGAAYSALTIEKIEQHKVSIPKSIFEQKSIVTKLNALSTETKKLETIYKQKLAALEELKKSVLQRAFNGDLC